MKRIYIPKPCYCALPFFHFVKNQGNLESSESSMNKQLNDEAIKRVMKVFRIQEKGGLTKEFGDIGRSFCASFVIGGVLGAIFYSRKGLKDFHAFLNVTRYIDPFEAKQHQADMILHDVFRGFVSGGTRMGVFTAVSGLFIISISAYRNYYGIFEWIIGAMIGGIFATCDLGIKMVAAGCVGGAVCGSILGMLSFIFYNMSTNAGRDLKKLEHILQNRMKNKLTREEKYDEEPDYKQPVFILIKNDDTANSDIKNSDAKLKDVINQK